MKKLNDRFMLKLWLSYSVILIFALIMGIYMYYAGIKSARNNLLSSNYATLKNSVSDVDNSIQIISSLSSQVTSNSNLLKIMRTKEINDGTFFVDILKARDYLTNLLPMQNITFVENLFLYLHNTDYILSSNLLESSSLFYNYAKRYDKQYYDDYINHLVDPAYAGTIQSLVQFDTKTPNELLLYVLPASMYYLGSPLPASLCYEINTKELKAVFSGINLYDTGSIYIVDRLGNEVLDITTNHSYYIDTELLKSLDNATDKVKPTLIKVEDKNMLVTAIVSQSNQWTYYLVQPEAMAFKELESIQKTYTTIIVFTIALGAITILLLSIKNYKPFILLESRIKNYLAEEDVSAVSHNKNLVNSLDNYVDRLIQRKDILQETLEHQRPIIYSSYLARLMNEIIENKSELISIANALHLNIEEEHILLSLTIYLDNLNFYIDDFITSNSDTYKILIKDILFSTYGTQIHIYDSDHHTFGILIPTSGGNNPSNILEKFVGIQKVLHTEYNILIFAGISNPYNQLNFTWQAYQQAVESLSHTGPDNIFQEYHTIKKMNDSYHYPNELSQQLINAIHSGKEKRVEEILKYLYNENFVERSLSITMIKWLLSDLRNTLLKARFMISADNTSNELIHIDELFQGKKSYVLIENLAIHLCRFFEPKNTSNTLISNIKQYIKENYQDSSLGLNKISDIFNISESYFSHLFKEETKENFSEYLEKLRIDLAMKLLKSTEMSIADIATEVGYNSALSFRRAFKKVHGITPMATRTNATVISEVAITNDLSTRKKVEQ